MKSENCLNVSVVSQGNTKNLRHKTSRNRSRSWCFTLNNHTDENYVSMSQVKSWPGEIMKLIFQEEIGNENTEHLQGFVKFKNQIDFNILKKWNEKIHWEKTRSDKASIKYCSKVESANGKRFTFGIEKKEMFIPLLTQEEMLADMRRQAKEEIMNGNDWDINI